MLLAFVRNFESSDGSQTLNGRRGKNDDECILHREKLLVEIARDSWAGERGVTSLVEIIQGHEDNSGVGGVHKAIDGQAGKRDGMFYTGMLQGNVGHLADDGF